MSAVVYANKVKAKIYQFKPFIIMSHKCHGWYAYRLKSKLVLLGTGPLACLSLFPVAELDKESWD